MKHLITDIQRFSLNDGPGIRTTVFFKGCNMRCAWCHNPETLSMSQDLMFYPSKCIGCGKCFDTCPVHAHKFENGVHIIDREICAKCGKCADICYAEAPMMSGKEMTVEQIMSEIRQDKAYYDGSNGGVTLSGGEVLCHTEFATEIARACRKEGFSVSIETNLSTTGWNPAPRVERPTPWMSKAEGVSSYREVNCAPRATCEELLEGASRFADFVRTEMREHFIGHILTFAWNEFEEGGYICPTYGKDGKIDRTRVDTFFKISAMFRKTLSGK